MKRFALLLVLFSLSGGAAAARNYADRDDVRAFIAEMHDKHGFAVVKLTKLFRQAKPQPAVLKAMAPPTQAAPARNWRTYRERFVEPKHIDLGLKFWRDNAAALGEAHERYGVPEEILVAIIGVETYYGRRAGKFETFSALTTLAFDYPPRAELFRRELEQLLLLARESHRDPRAYRGSFAGAIGIPQFLPGTARSYAVDFDGTGSIDLSASPSDAIGSIAHFLMQRGWERDGLIAVAATVDGDRCIELLADGISPKRTPAEMAAYGVSAVDAPAQPAALIDLATPDAETEYRLGFQNFWVLTRYNRANFYAAAVADLAQALAAARQEKSQ